MLNRAEQKIHYDLIDALKGLAIFLVVLGHSIIYYPINLHENTICQYAFNLLSTVHMPLFFIVSGFCFSYKVTYGEYINKKIKRIMIPYLVFNAVDVIPRCLLPSLVNRSRGIGESLYKIVFEGGEYWFLYTLFLIFLIYPFIYKILNGDKKIYIITLAVLLVISSIIPEVSVFTFSKVIKFLFYFTLGTFLKVFYKEAFLSNHYLEKYSKVAMVVMSFFWCILVKLDFSFFSIMTSITGLTAIFLIMRNEAVVNMFKRFGEYSLQLYLFNGFFLVASRTLIVNIFGMTNPVVIIAFNMIIDFYLSYLIIKYVCSRIRLVRIMMGIL